MRRDATQGPHCGQVPRRRGGEQGEDGSSGHQDQVVERVTSPRPQLTFFSLSFRVSPMPAQRLSQQTTQKDEASKANIEVKTRFDNCRVTVRNTLVRKKLANVFEAGDQEKAVQDALDGLNKNHPVEKGNFETRHTEKAVPDEADDVEIEAYNGLERYLFAARTDHMEGQLKIKFEAEDNEGAVRETSSCMHRNRLAAKDDF